MATRCACGPRSWWRSVATSSRSARRIARASRCASRGSPACARTRRRGRRRPSRSCGISTSDSSTPRAGRRAWCKIQRMNARVSTGVPRLDAMLGGGLLPGTLALVYGATGIGKTHLGLTFADHGRAAESARGVVLDMNGRGDSQQHDEYAARLFEWSLKERTHTVTPMTDTYPWPDQRDAIYCNALSW